MPREVGLLESCLTLCNPMDCSPPGSSVHGISQARILEWVTVSFSRRSSQPKELTWVTCIAGGCFTIWATREVGMSHLLIFQDTTSTRDGLFEIYYIHFPGFPDASAVKKQKQNSPAVQETQVRSLVWKDPLERRKWKPSPLFLPGKSHRQRSLAGYNPWGFKKCLTWLCD